MGRPTTEQLELLAAVPLFATEVAIKMLRDIAARLQAADHRLTN